MGKILKCDVCGFETNTEYWDNGFIAHDNETSDWNLIAEFRRSGVESLATIKNTMSDTSKIYVLKHRLIWLKKHHPELAESFLIACGEMSTKLHTL